MHLKSYNFLDLLLILLYNFLLNYFKSQFPNHCHFDYIIIFIPPNALLSNPLLIPPKFAVFISPIANPPKFGNTIPAFLRLYNYLKFTLINWFCSLSLESLLISVNKNIFLDNI